MTNGLAYHRLDRLRRRRNTSYARPCSQCGKSLIRPHSRFKHVANPFCSRDCLKIYKAIHDTHPYRRIWIGGKYVEEHRWVAEQMLGRKLLPREVVHHADGNKRNNAPSNLRVLGSNSEHGRLHHPFKADREKVKELRSNGYSTDKIAGILKVSDSSILRVLKTLPNYSKLIPVQRKWDTALAEELRKQGLTYEGIGKLIGASRSAVGGYFSRRGFQ